MVVYLAGTLFFSHDGCFKFRNDANGFWSCTAHRKRASASCVSPIIPPSFFITPLFCSWPWFGQWQSRRISSETWPIRTYLFEILEQYQGVLYRDYVYLLHEQASIESSECGLVWRTKVSAWLVCLHTNQSLLYAKKAHMPVLAVPVQGSCTSKGTENAYPFVVYTSRETLWVTLREAFHMHIICFPQEDMQCTSSNLIGKSGTGEVGCFFCVYHVSKRNLGSLATT